MNHITNLVLGDWSGDGHDKSDVETISSNLTTEQIESAYKKGSKKLGFDLIEEVACDYEDSSLPEDIVAMLNVAGFKVEHEVGTFDGKLDNLCTDSFLSIFLFVVRIGNPAFMCKPVHTQTINIGGYGLYD